VASKKVTNPNHGMLRPAVVHRILDCINLNGPSHEKRA
jgi:hypothetical protein